MRHSLHLFTLVALLTGLCACSDFGNRTYRYHESIPLRPIVLKLVKTELGNLNGKMAVKVTLDITNPSADKLSLSKERFTLRVGKSREIARDLSLLESLGIETISFKPSEEASISTQFILTEPELRERLCLIVDRQRKGDRETLVLIEVKRQGTPPLPVSGEWRVMRSSNWNN